MSAPAVITGAKSRLDQAQADYNRALEAGDGTAEARERLKYAQADFEAVRAQASWEAERAEAERLRRLQEAAGEEAQAAERQIAEHLAQLSAVPLPPVALPVGVFAGVLDARHRAEQAAEAAAEASAKVQHLRDRLRQLEQRRAAVIARRQAGNVDDRLDSAELALIAADSEGLAELLVQAESAAAGPEREAATAAAAVGHAEGQWQQAQQRATAQALAVVCLALENALVSAAADLYPHRLSGVAPWQPGQALKHTMTFGVPLGRPS